MLLLCDIPHLQHVTKNLIPSFQGVFRVAVWVIIGRGVGYCAQISRLAQAQLIGIFSKIASGSRLKPIICIGKVNVINIKFHDLLFRVLLCQIHGNDYFLYLSPDGNIPCEILVSGKLLGDGAGPVDLLPSCQYEVNPHTGDSLEVHAAVFPESAVLHRHEGIYCSFWYLLVGQILGIHILGQLCHNLSG